MNVIPWKNNQRPAITLDLESGTLGPKTIYKRNKEAQETGVMRGPLNPRYFDCDEALFLAYHLGLAALQLEAAADMLEDDDPEAAAEFRHSCQLARIIVNKVEQGLVTAEDMPEGVEALRGLGVVA